LKIFDQQDVYANSVRIYRQIVGISEPSSDIRCSTKSWGLGIKYLGSLLNKENIIQDKERKNDKQSYCGRR